MAERRSMRRRLCRLAVVACLLVVALGDDAFARYRRRGRRGGGGFATTAQAAALMGYAQLLRAQAGANLQNSRAAINWENAKTLEIQNRLRWEETYFHMRQVNHAMLLAERGPRVTQSDATRLAHEGMPPRLEPRDLDPETGRITYPEVLQDPRFAELRADVDDFFRRRAAMHGSMDFNALRHVDTILELLHVELANHVAEYPAGPYGHAVTFLERLGVEAHLPSR